MQRLAAIVPFLLLACSGADPDADSGAECSGKCDDLSEGAGGTPLVSCWVEPDPDEDQDPFFAVDRLVCRYDAPAGALAPALRGVTVNVSNAGGGHGGEFLDRRAGEALELLAFSPEKYPVEVDLSLSLSFGSDEIGGGFVGLDDLFRLEHRFTIAAAADATAEAPATMALPFELWPVTITGGDGSMVGSLDEYTLSVAPYEVSRSVDGDPSTYPVRQDTILVREAESLVFLIPVDPGTTALTGTGDFGTQETAFTIAGPGDYIVEDGALQPAEAVTPATGGPELARCSVAGDALSCALTGALEGLEVTAAEVEVTPAGGAPSSVAIEGSEPSQVATLAASDYPATVRVSLTFSGEVLGVDPQLFEMPYTVALELAGPEDATEAAPAVIAAPFATWIVELHGQMGLTFFGDLDSYQVRLPAPWRGERELDITDAALFVNGEGQKTLTLAVPPDTEELSGTATVFESGNQREIPFSITPGSYQATADGLVPLQ